MSQSGPFGTQPELLIVHSNTDDKAKQDHPRYQLS